jgi:hypothetical protein
MDTGLEVSDILQMMTAQHGGVNELASELTPKQIDIFVVSNL